MRPSSGGSKPSSGKRHLEVLPPKSEADDTRPAWHWVVIGAVGAFLFFVLGAQLSQAFAHHELARWTASAERSAARTAYLHGVVYGLPLVCLALSTWFGGLLVGRFGGRAGVREAVGSGLAAAGIVAMIAATSMWSAGEGAAWGLATLVLLGVGAGAAWRGGVRGLRRRALRPPPVAVMALFVGANTVAATRVALAAGPEEGSDGSRRGSARIGIEAASRRLTDGETAERLRGVDRLAAFDDDEARRRLRAQLVPGTPLYEDQRARLAAVRVLARHLDVEANRAALRTAYGEALDADPGTLSALVRDTAGLALARWRQPETLRPLLAAVLAANTRGAAVARRQLLAHPPDTLDLFRTDTMRFSPAALSLLGELADPRALGWLRAHLDEGRVGPAPRRAAALALARLGDDHARAFLSRGKKGDAVAMTEVAIWLEQPDAPKRVATLLAKAKTRRAGLRLAALSLAPALVPTLVSVARADVTPAERRAAVAILADIGEERAAGALLDLLARPPLSRQVALALARNQTEVARRGLARARAEAANATQRRFLLRAEIVRALRTGQRGDGLVAQLRQSMRGGEDPAERAVGAFGLGALGVAPVTELLQARAPEIRAAAARAALARGPSALEMLVPLLADPATRRFAGAALLVGRGGLSPHDLAMMAEEGGIFAPLAAYRLAAIDSLPHRPRLRALLAGTDPGVRLQVLLGLAHSPEPDAVAMLVDAYRFEVDPLMRRAALSALGARSERSRTPTLRLARDLDPEPELRGLAADALEGRLVGPRAAPAGGRTLWVTLEEIRPSGASAARPVVVIRSDGLAWPALSAPDGVLLVPGLAERGDGVSLRLAPSPLAPAERRADGLPANR